MMMFGYVNASGNVVSVAREGDFVYVTVSTARRKDGVAGIVSLRRQADAAARSLPSGYRVTFPAIERTSAGIAGTAVGYLSGPTKVYRAAPRA